MQIDAEKAPFLVERLKIWMLPTLALVRRQKTVDYVVGFDDVGGKDDFATEVSRLNKKGIESNVNRTWKFNLRLTLS